MRLNKLLASFVITSLLVSPMTASAFTPHTVENTEKVILHWGDISKKVSNNNSTEDFSGSIFGSQRILALQTINFESNDELENRDSRSNFNRIEFTSKIKNGVDGLVLLVSKNEDKLVVDLAKLGSQTIDLNDLRNNDFSFADGNYELKAEYLGSEFLETPSNPSTAGAFSDTPSGEWFFKYVQRIKNRDVQGNKIFEGYKDTTGNLTGFFGPGDNITLGQMMKVVLRVSGYDENNSNLDSKIANLNHWSTGFLNTGIDLDLTVMEPNTIVPTRTVTRGEFFQTLAEAQGLISNTYQCPLTGFEFKDLSANHPNTKAACILVRDGIIAGSDSGFLNLDENINRAEVAKILNTALDIYVEQPTVIESILDDINTLSEDNPNPSSGGSSSNNNTGNNSSGSNNSGSSSGGSSSNGGSNTNSGPQSFINDGTVVDGFIAFNTSLKIEYSTPEDFRLDDLDIEIQKLTIDSQTGATLRDDITNIADPTFNEDTGILSVLLTSQWGTGKYTISTKDNELNELTSYDFEVLFCGEQDNPCPAGAEPFVRDGQVRDAYVGYIDSIRIDFPNGDAVRESDLEYTLVKDSSGADQTNLLVTTFDSSKETLSIRQSSQWGSGEYTLTIKDTPLNDEKVFNFEILNCGDQGDECPSGNPFLLKSELTDAEFGFISPFRVTFDEPENVRVDDLEFILERIEVSPDGNGGVDVNRTPVTNLNLPPIFSSETGTLSLFLTSQWGSGDYEIQLKDTSHNETKTFGFTVLPCGDQDNPC